MLPAAPGRRLGALLPATLAALAPVVLPAVARAATVRVDERVVGSANTARLYFQAANGEDNAVTVAPAGEEGTYLRLEVIDAGAQLQPGERCSGGGTPGTPVTCMLHKPERGYTVIGGKIAVPDIDRTWEAGFSIDLGDGRNSFDAHGVPGTGSTAISMNVVSGAGDDTILTAEGEDTIDPGYGADVVRTAGGYDRAIATPTPDVSDIYDLGPDTDKVDYSARQTPVVLNGQRAGAEGENDLLVIGSPYVVGGSGDDALVGGGGADRLEGGPGDDSLEGGGGADELVGGEGEDSLSGEAGSDLLVGGPGDDRLDGGAGDDVITDALRLTEPGSSGLFPSPPPQGPSGRDVGLGGAGRDRIGLGGEADLVQGGGGNDIIAGGTGPDRLLGNGGGDQIVGGRGDDRILGGAGSDLLFGGRVSSERDLLLRAPDDGPDRLDCGGARDAASADPWDTVRGCESISILPEKRRGGRAG